MSEQSCPKVWITCVDIKDVALAHYRAIVVEQAANKRFIVCRDDGLMLGDLGQILDQTLKSEGHAY